MPLLDHFHSPLSERRPWESFNTTWASVLADTLNRDILPPSFIALEHVHAGAAVEIDVATYREGTVGTTVGERGGTATLPRAIWTPAGAPLVIPAEFPTSCTVEIHSTEGGRTLAGAIELVSPANKDRETVRRQFAAKCATYLSRGVGLIVVDVVTSRKVNLHNALLDLLQRDSTTHMAPGQHLYGVAYRPLQEEGVGRIEMWAYPLALGQPLPTLPLSLEAELCVPVDLEAAYQEACLRRRVAEAAD